MYSISCRYFFWSSNDTFYCQSDTDTTVENKTKGEVESTQGGKTKHRSAIFPGLNVDFLPILFPFRCFACSHIDPYFAKKEQIYGHLSVWVGPEERQGL